MSDKPQKSKVVKPQTFSNEAAPKVKINKTLIKKTDSIPEELKSLGVNAYNENEFERGVMMQVDLQLAEYELQQAKAKMFKLGVNEDTSTTSENDSKQSSGIDELASIKKRKNSKVTETLEDFKKKRAKFDTKLNNIQNYIDNKPIQSSDDSQMDAQRLIELGEMTPFGTTVDSSSKLRNKLSDFDKFFMDFDSQKPKKKIVKNEKEPQKAQEKSTEPLKKKLSEFDLFFTELDATNMQKVNSKKPKKTVNKKSTLITNNQHENNSLNASFIEENLSEFDKFFNEMDNQKNDEKKKTASRKSKPQNSESDSTLAFIAQLEDEQNTNSLDSFKMTDSFYQIDDSIDKIDDDIDSKSDKDSDYLPEANEESQSDFVLSDFEQSEIEYETDSDTSDDGTQSRRRKLSKNYLDDGDDKIFNKRIKKLEKQEKKEQDEKQKNKIENDDYEHELDYFELDGDLRVPSKVWNRLYKFQKTGLKWLWELHGQRTGGILGDEMGLGKTIQMISFLSALKYSKLPSTGFPYNGLGPTLIISKIISSIFFL